MRSSTEMTVTPSLTAFSYLESGALPATTQEELDTDDPVRWAGAMAALKEEFGIRILGGCCGTDERYIRRLALYLTGKQ